MASFLKYWLPALGWMGIIFYMSSLQHPAPGDLALIPDWISHPVVYAILALFLCRALAAGKPLTLGAALLAVVFATLYGVSDEWHQSFVPLRDASALDVVKDFAGAVLGAGAFVRFGPSRKRRVR